MERNDIHIIGRHSNLTEKEIARALKENVYNDRESWKKFFRLFFISLGVGFTVSGIVFFFAYNWAGLHKFAKIGLAEGLLIATTILLFHKKINNSVRNTILTGASVIIGVLFAVFGQIYQTGADAYDLFLTWTVFVTLWVLVSNFTPLWLLYLILINTTFVLYSQQVAKNWSEVFVFTLLLIINTAVLIFVFLFVRKRTPNWFVYTVALASVICATIGIVIGIFGENQTALSMSILILTTAIIFALGIWIGLKTKSGFYLGVIPFSLIIIVSALLIEVLDGEIIVLVVSSLIIAGVTLTIRNLINFQKRWANE